MISVEYTYLSSNRAIEIANETFQYNGWSCSIVDVTPDFVCITSDNRNLTVIDR